MQVGEPINRRSVNLTLLHKVWLPNNRQSVYNIRDRYLNQYNNKVKQVKIYEKRGSIYIIKNGWVLNNKIRLKILYVYCT